MKAKVIWQNGLRFLGVARDRAIIIDTSKEYGGFETGPTPMEILLMSVGACTGMDVVSILKKMKIKLDGFEIEVSGEQQEAHPKYFTRVTLVYRFLGKDLPVDKIKHAVELSFDKYCSVTGSLREPVEVDYEIEISQD
ncbi:MAG TPA: OsmC family peroxiredoxin [bacterium (Candidatus Stahlbacteria)]|nr:OsmC family peroxiredoxin [Candidatus Stahlbacteria bacterium]